MSTCFSIQNPKPIRRSVPRSVPKISSISIVQENATKLNRLSSQILFMYL